MDKRFGLLNLFASDEEIFFILSTQAIFDQMACTIVRSQVVIVCDEHKC
jgi:hypothetical protein